MSNAKTASATPAASTPSAFARALTASKAAVISDPVKTIAYYGVFGLVVGFAVQAGAEAAHALVA